MRHKNHENDFHHLLWRTGCPCQGHCDCVTLSKLSPPRPHASHQWTRGGWLHTGDWGLRDIPVGPGTERVLSESPSLFPRYLFFSDWQSCCSCAKTGCSAFGRLRVTCSQSWDCAGCRGLRALTCMAKRKPKGQVLTQVGRLVPWALWLPCLSLRKAKVIISPCCAAAVSVVRGWGGFTKSPGKDRTSLFPPAPFQPLPSPGYLDLLRIRLCVL